jgi:PH domain
LQRHAKNSLGVNVTSARHGILFSDYFVLAKDGPKKQVSEIFSIWKIVVSDVAESENRKFCFMLRVDGKKEYVFGAATNAEKQMWISKFEFALLTAIDALSGGKGSTGALNDIKAIKKSASRDRIARQKSVGTLTKNPSLDNIQKRSDSARPGDAKGHVKELGAFQLTLNFELIQGKTIEQEILEKSYVSPLDFGSKSFLGDKHGQLSSEKNSKTEFSMPELIPVPQAKTNFYKSVSVDSDMGPIHPKKRSEVVLKKLFEEADDGSQQNLHLGNDGHKRPLVGPSPAAHSKQISKAKENSSKTAGTQEKPTVIKEDNLQSVKSETKISRQISKEKLPVPAADLVKPDQPRSSRSKGNLTTSNSKESLSGISGTSQLRSVSPKLSKSKGKLSAQNSKENLAAIAAGNSAAINQSGPVPKSNLGKVSQIVSSAEKIKLSSSSTSLSGNAGLSESNLRKTNETWVNPTTTKPTTSEATIPKPLKSFAVEKVQANIDTKPRIVDDPKPVVGSDELPAVSVKNQIAAMKAKAQQTAPGGT